MKTSQETSDKAVMYAMELELDPVGSTVRYEMMKLCAGQGCISCGPCSYPELTEDHVLPSA